MDSNTTVNLFLSILLLRIVDTTLTHILFYRQEIMIQFTMKNLKIFM